MSEPTVRTPAAAAPAGRSVDERRRAFRALHGGGCFVIPNPWDAGTARWLERLGFPALASTSAGLAFSLGLPDAALSREAVLAHLRELVAAAEVPVAADFQGGYAVEPGEVARNVGLCLETGVAGLSIEDASGRPDEPLLPLDLSVARIRAARAAVDAAGGGAVLTGRSEGFVAGRPDLRETIRRLEAYADAGADCLHAPGLRTREEIGEVVRALAPRPVNVVVASVPTLGVAELAALGVRRISVGSGLARVAWTAFARAAGEIAGAGRFGSLAGLRSNAELDAFFREDLARRRGS